MSKVVSYDGGDMADNRLIEHIERVMVRLSAKVFNNPRDSEKSRGVENLIILRDTEKNLGVYHPALNERLVWWFNGAYDVDKAVERYDAKMTEIEAENAEDAADMRLTDAEYFAKHAPEPPHKGNH